ncbi:MAG: nitrilase-related carbon-nitrogen hydrolase [Promethearchaeota archaeon]
MKIKKQTSNQSIKSYIALVIGTIFYGFIAWNWHMPLAGWIAPSFLMFFFRIQKKFLSTLLAIPLLSIASFLKINGGWDMPIIMIISVSILIPTVLMALPLYADKYLFRKMKSEYRTLIFPSIIVIVEFIIGLSPLGTVFSLGATQVEHTAFLQFASLAGMWGLSFIMAWTAPVINTLIEKDFSIRNPSALAKVFSVIFAFSILFGAFRLAVVDPSSPTVRIGSISVAHERDYWSIVDDNTPQESKDLYGTEMKALEDELYNISQKAVDGGAQIVFWSEGDAVFYEDQETTFLNRAKTFAQENQIYFAPAVLKLYYNSTISDNMIYMITPDGDVAFDYVKTISWYETTSDGIMDYLDTPYGRISSAICFDNDFPAFIRQAGRNHVDILLVPAFDTANIKEFHGQTAMIRGVENGMSVVRQSNTGCSYAVDYLGNIVAYQDFFDTSEPLMYSDIPTKGTNTLYTILGDWVVYGCMAILLIYTGFYFAKRYEKSPKLTSVLFSIATE